MAGPNDGDVVWSFHLFVPLSKSLVQTEKYELLSRLSLNLLDIQDPQKMISNFSHANIRSKLQLD